MQALPSAPGAAESHPVLVVSSRVRLGAHVMGWLADEPSVIAALTVTVDPIAALMPVAKEATKDALPLGVTLDLMGEMARGLDNGVPTWSIREVADLRLALDRAVARKRCRSSGGDASTSADGGGPKEKKPRKKKDATSSTPGDADVAADCAGLVDPEQAAELVVEEVEEIGRVTGEEEQDLMRDLAEAAAAETSGPTPSLSGSSQAGAASGAAAGGGRPTGSGVPKPGKKPKPGAGGRGAGPLPPVIGAGRGGAPKDLTPAQMLAARLQEAGSGHRDHP